MYKNLILFTLILFSLRTFAQRDYMPALNFIEEGKVKVRLSYMRDRNSTLFSAYNELDYPVYLHLYFKDVSRLSFHEKQPYVKKLPHGLTDLFVLDHSHEYYLLKFPFEIKIYPSNPLVVVDMEFPYLLPFREGEIAIPVKADTTEQVLSIIPNKEDGFYYGFQANPGQEICACRKGVIVDIFSSLKTEQLGNFQDGYSYITLLHDDGTLATYFNAVSNENRLKLNQTIYPGEVFAKLNAISDKVIVAVYYNRLFFDDFIFISPKFQLADSDILEVGKEYTVVHSKEIRALEMTNKEKKKILGKI